ncbi:hypothetical protein Tcan_08072 [Toxocara canis]|uniref:Uncharacterized protein n=1 Tax=Toxocara canis TaxID=6265 RepID=A0A0B2UPI2_TOXCA|nr:hypothetical protein Tcan_08072 [Toxocara canis]
MNFVSAPQATMRSFLVLFLIFRPLSGQIAQGGAQVKFSSKRHQRRLFLRATSSGQIAQGGAQVKISDMPFPVANAQQLSQIVWTMLGTTTKETIYCVSEAPVSQLRFVCVDCFQKNITDMVNVLSGAQDLTRSAGFPVD